jgi:catechol 2,3-dioxygenase-like lactoylglutathione lyase family enzyme
MQRPKTYGINHLKLPARDLHRTLAFYTDVMGCEYIQEYDHRNAQGELFAVMVKFKQQSTSDMIIEIRKNEEYAHKQVHWDPITWGVSTRRDLEDWKAWFEHCNVKCSAKIFTGLKGWVLSALDPDKRIVRIYCDEEHEWTTEFDHDEFWLR